MANGRSRFMLPPPARAAAALEAAADVRQRGAPRWKEFFVYTADFVGAAALAAGVANADPTAAGMSFQAFPIKIQSDADFEWLKTVYLFTDPRVYARFQDDTAGRFLHRSSLDLRAAAGFGISFASIVANLESTAFLPFIEPEPYTIAAASVFTVYGADFSGALNTVRLSLHGNKVRPGWAPWERDAAGQVRRFRARVPFKIVMPPDGTPMAITANATVPLSAPIDLEADYLVERITAIHTGSALVTLQDGPGRDRLWSDRPVDISVIAGDGRFPNILPSPRFVYRGSSIQAQVQDTSAATNRVKFIFSGVKLYAA